MLENQLCFSARTNSWKFVDLEEFNLVPLEMSFRKWFQILAKRHIFSLESIGSSCGPLYEIAWQQFVNKTN